MVFASAHIEKYLKVVKRSIDIINDKVCSFSMALTNYSPSPASLFQKLG